MKVALRELPQVLIYDNGDLRTPFRHVATFQQGQRVGLKPPLPSWLKNLLP